MKKQISIIGCGWLGLPLSKFLIDEGFIVKGSTTSSDKLNLLKKNRIEGYLVHLNETEITGDYFKFLEDSDTIIINIPPGLRKQPNKNHVTEVKHLISAIETHHIKHVLYISSTSVFNNETNFPEIKDSTVPNATSNTTKQLIEIEQLLQNNPHFETTILRFGGLFDEKRHPARYLSGRKNIENPEAPINLIHKDDCIQIISKILKNNIWKVSLNAVYPKHLDKKTYYSTYCQRLNILLPQFNTTVKSKGKIIDSSKLVQLLNYTFKHAP